MMHHIRPYQLFTLVEGLPDDRLVRIPIPYRRGTGSVSTLETMVLCTAMRLVDAKTVFEIGTYLGATTLNLGLNLDDGTIYTLDFGPEDAIPDQHAADAPLTRTHLEIKTYDYVGSSAASKIKVLKGNSVTFDFTPYQGAIDMVYIDGGHDYDTVTRDTENAFKMLRADKPSCIVWHDYGNPEYNGLSYRLDTLAEQRDCFHIEDTMMVVHFSDTPPALIE